MKGKSRPATEEDVTSHDVLARFALWQATTPLYTAMMEFSPSYFHRVRDRTMRVMRCVPPDKIDWTYRTGKFTIGDIARHLASIERWMFAENARLQPSTYPGHGAELADGYDAVVAY